VDAGLAGIAPDTDIDALIDGAMWWPEYVPYIPHVPAAPAAPAADGETGP
jgi:hypothetical protein